MARSKQKTYWNGEPCEARRLTAVVADAPFPLYWAADHIGSRRAVVEVTYGDRTFYLDDEDGAGWEKVTAGQGSPDLGHRSLEIEPDTVEEVTG